MTTKEMVARMTTFLGSFGRRGNRQGRRPGVRNVAATGGLHRRSTVRWLGSLAEFAQTSSLIFGRWAEQYLGALSLDRYQGAASLKTSRHTFGRFFQRLAETPTTPTTRNFRLRCGSFRPCGPEALELSLSLVEAL